MKNFKLNINSIKKQLLIVVFFCQFIIVKSQITPPLKINSPTTQRLLLKSNYIPNNLQKDSDYVSMFVNNDKSSDTISAKIIKTLVEDCKKNKVIDHDRMMSYRSFLKYKDKKFNSIIRKTLIEEKRELSLSFNDTAENQKHQKNINQINELDHIYSKQSKNEWSDFYVLRYAFLNKKTARFFPVKDNFSAQLYFKSGIDSQKFLSNSGINLNNAAVYSEIYHDYIGPFRIGLSAAVSSNSNDSSVSDSVNTKNDVFSRLLTSGGNLVINATLPIFLAKSHLGFYSFHSHFNNKTGMDLQAQNSIKGKPNIINESSLDGLITLIGVENKVTFFVYGKLSYIYGNQPFNELVGLAKKQFTQLNQLSFGLELGNYIRLSYNVYGGNSSVKSVFSDGLSFTFINNI